MRGDYLLFTSTWQAMTLVREKNSPAKYPAEGHRNSRSNQQSTWQANLLVRRWVSVMIIVMARMVNENKDARAGPPCTLFTWKRVASMVLASRGRCLCHQLQSGNQCFPCARLTLLAGVLCSWRFKWALASVLSPQRWPWNGCLCLLGVFLIHSPG